uniref:Hypothetical_protein n=1 Tax=Oryza glaberrima TaxID=4538 RepID=G2XLH1_ORYGL|nr:hypothetical_protein [Oryza glaberrima]
MPSSLPCRCAVADSPPPGRRLSPAAASPRSPSPLHRSAPPPTRCSPSRIHRHPIWPLCPSRQLALAPSRRLAPSLPVAVAPHQVVADPIADRSPSGLHQIAAAPPDHYPRSSGEDQDTIHVLDRSQIGGHQVQLSWSLLLIRTSRFIDKKDESLEGLLEQSVTARFVENLGVGTRMEEDGTYLLWSMRDYAMQYKKGRRWEL